MNDKALISLSFEGHSVRFVGTPEKPEWIAKDVCDVLGIQEHRSVLRDFDGDERGVHTLHSTEGPREHLTVTEPGLYRLIFKSRKEEAKRFQKWVFGVALPEIRKHGLPSQQPSRSLPMPESNREKLENIRFAYDLIEDLGGADEVTRLALKDAAKNVVLGDQLLIASPASDQGRLSWPVSDRVLHLGYSVQISSTLIKIGKVMAKKYQERHGQSAPTREQFVGGATRMVKHYGEDDVDLLDEAIKEVLGAPPARTVIPLPLFDRPS